MTPTGSTSGSIPGAIPAPTATCATENTLTAEVRLVSKEGGELFGGATAWTVGAYTLRQDVALTRQSTFIDSDFTSDYGIDRFALFGQTETMLDASSTLTVGLRLERHSATYDDSANVNSAPEDSLVGGRVSYGRELAPGIVGYGSISRGYKAGGFNIDGTFARGSPRVRSGGPVELRGGAQGAGGWTGCLSFRGSVFRMQRDDGADRQFHRDIVHDDGSTEFIDFVGNAAQGTNSGAELDVEITPSDASLAVRARWSSPVGVRGLHQRRGDGSRRPAHRPTRRGTSSASGPDFTGSARGISRKSMMDGRDEFYFSDSHNEKSAPYTLLNASVGYRGRDWSVTAWARNLANEDYFVRGFFFGNDPRDGYTDRVFTQLGEPRRFGITASRSW